MTYGQTDRWMDKEMDVMERHTEGKADRQTAKRWVNRQTEGWLVR